jgi:hypothetical protein
MLSCGRSTYVGVTNDRPLPSNGSLLSYVIARLLCRNIAMDVSSGFCATIFYYCQQDTVSKRCILTYLFLRSCQLYSPSRTQHFMKPEGSIPCSQEPSTGPYPEPDPSNPSKRCILRKRCFGTCVPSSGLVPTYNWCIMHIGYI